MLFRKPQRLDLPPDESANLEELEAFSKVYLKIIIYIAFSFYLQGKVMADIHLHSTVYENLYK